MEAVVKHTNSFWQGRRVLVTGHTGFKGSWLTLWLLELGAEVSGFALAPESIDQSHQPLFQRLDLASRLGDHHQIGDIRDSEKLSSAITHIQPEVVLHLAAQPLVRKSYEDPLGTWSTNVQGSLQLLEALKPLQRPCAVVMVTTDKVYENQEWVYGYRESDTLGGNDPYSASKAAAELAIASWRNSFCGSARHQTQHLAIASARAGNVIGGGDWAADRIVPDAVRALSKANPISVRHPKATRPWQHILEPLSGYIKLAEALLHTQTALSQSETEAENIFASPFNFGPAVADNRSVRELVEEMLQHWKGSWCGGSDLEAPHEAGRLHLQIDKAHHQLGWQPRWDFTTTVARTMSWYRAVHEGANPLECCLTDLNAYTGKDSSAY